MMADSVLFLISLQQGIKEVIVMSEGELELGRLNMQTMPSEYIINNNIYYLLRDHVGS